MYRLEEQESCEYLVGVCCHRKRGFYQTLTVYLLMEGVPIRLFFLISRVGNNEVYISRNITIDEEEMNASHELSVGLLKARALTVGVDSGARRVISGCLCRNHLSFY